MPRSAIAIYGRYYLYSLLATAISYVSTVAIETESSMRIVINRTSLRTFRKLTMCV